MRNRAGVVLVTGTDLSGFKWSRRAPAFTTSWRKIFAVVLDGTLFDRARLDALRASTRH
jgi:hypothetical protein